MLWLVRHGRVAEEYQPQAYGNLDVPLSTDGEAQTRAVGSAFARLPLGHVASSHLSRALAMGRAIAAASGASLSVDERLREIDRGAWQGLSREEFARRWGRQAQDFHADPFGWSSPQGESDDDIWKRLAPALEAALGAAGGAGLAVTAHYNLIRVAVTRCLGLSPRESFAFRNDPAHVSLLRAEPEGWVMVRANVAEADLAAMCAG